MADPIKDGSEDGKAIIAAYNAWINGDGKDLFFKVPAGTDKSTLVPEFIKWLNTAPNNTAHPKASELLKAGGNPEAKTFVVKYAGIAKPDESGWGIGRILGTLGGLGGGWLLFDKITDWLGLDGILGTIVTAIGAIGTALGLGALVKSFTGPEKPSGSDNTAINKTIDDTRAKMLGDKTQKPLEMMPLGEDKIALIYVDRSKEPPISRTLIGTIDKKGKTLTFTHVQKKTADGKVHDIKLEGTIKINNLIGADGKLVPKPDLSLLNSLREAVDRVLPSGTDKKDLVDTSTSPKYIPARKPLSGPGPDMSLS